MFKAAKHFFKKKQPVSYTGMLTHTYSWLTSPSKDLVYTNPNYKPVEGQDGVVIYCVHGTADRPAAFTRITKRLIKLGLPPTVASVHLVSFEGRGKGLGIDDFSEQLINKIKTNQHKRVIFMGHSRGGLVVTQAAETLATQGDITPLLCIGICAPYSGSHLALPPLSWFSSSVSEMQQESVFLRALNDKLADSTVPYHFVEAVEDGIVPPHNGYAQSYIDCHPGALSRYRRHGHLSIMSSQALVKEISQLITQILNSSDESKVEQTVTLKDGLDTLIEDYLPNL